MQACLLADSPDCPLTRMQEAIPEEDLGALQQTKDAFCIGLSLIREDGIAKTRERVEY